MPVVSERSSGRGLGVVATSVAVLLTGVLAVLVAVRQNHHVDLWIYSSGARLAMLGQSPYDVTAIHTGVAEQWPDDDLLIANSGFFLPPQALAVYAPWAGMPWAWAKLVWCLFTISVAVATAWGMRRLTDAPLPGWFTAAAVVAGLLNPHTLFGLFLGQSTWTVLGCVVFGEVAELAGRRRVGRLLWAVAFLKPHLAFPLLPLAWWLGGWRRAAEVLAWVCGLNVLAGVVFFGRPLFVLEYLGYVQSGHQTVEFNRVGGVLLTGWNRFVAACGGPAIELGVFGTLGGYTVFLAAVAVRSWVGAASPTRGWCFALAGCASLCCCQLQSYELPLLVLCLPYLIGLIHSPRPADRLAGLLVAAPVAVAMLPGWNIIAYHAAIDRVLGPEAGSLGMVLKSHPSLGVLLAGLGVLFAGPRQSLAGSTAGRGGV